MRDFISHCFLIILIIGSVSTSNVHANEPVGVCAVLDGETLYNNKKITIRANVVASIHGILASDDKHGVACGVVSIVVPVEVYERSVREGKVLPYQTNTGFYRAILTGKFIYRNDDGSRVHGVLYVKRILLWKSTPIPWNPSG